MFIPCRAYFQHDHHVIKLAYACITRGGEVHKLKAFGRNKTNSTVEKTGRISEWKKNKKHSCEMRYIVSKK